MASLFGKSSLSPEWVGRFREIAKLNIYAQSTPVRLSGVVIEGYDLSGVKLSGAQFEKTEWKNITLKSGEFVNTKFVHTSFDNVKFENVVLKDTVFEDVTFNESAFFQAQLQNVRFIRCQFRGTALQSLKVSTISFDDSRLEDVSFFRSAITATVKGSHFDNVDMRGLVTPSSLTFDKSDLKEVDMSRSKLSKLNATDSVVTESFINNGDVAEANFTGTVLHFGMSESSIRSLVMDDVTLTLMALDSTRIQSVMLRNCRKVTSIGFYEAQIEQLTAERCVLNNFRVPNATVGLLHIKDSQLSGSDFEELRAKTVILEDLTLKNKIDFTNAQIDRLTTKNVTKSPGLNLITTGSNVKFE